MDIHLQADVEVQVDTPVEETKPSRICVRKKARCMNEESSAWVKVYQIHSTLEHDGFEMQSGRVAGIDAVDVSKSAKFSDVDINNWAVEKDGWKHVYRLHTEHSNGSTYVRTNEDYDDTALSFGVGSQAEACFAESYAKCGEQGFETGWKRVSTGRIDNYYTFGGWFNNENRYAVWGGSPLAVPWGLCVEGRNCVTGGFQFTGMKGGKEDAPYGNYQNFTLSFYAGDACP